MTLSNSLSRLSILPILSVLVALSIPILGQETGPKKEGAAPATAHASVPNNILQRNIEDWIFQGRGMPDDWSHRYLVFSDPGTEEQAIASGTYDHWVNIINNPRYTLQHMKRDPTVRTFIIDELGLRTERSSASDIIKAESSGPEGAVQIGLTKPQKSKIKKDWGEGLKTGVINPNTYPAKWSFSTGTASCGNDFVVYPTGSAGSSTQASIIAYYNIYSGCGGTVPEVDWAYNTGGTVSLSPVFSLGGSQVAFVQTSSSVATLVLLKIPLTPPGAGTLASPVTLTNQSSGSAYQGCSAPCMFTITFSGSPNNTWSSPVYDYNSDSLYVGDASGKLHKFSPVFNGAPAEVSASWPVQLKHGSTNDTSQTNGPVYDPSSGKVFVGTFNGYLYSVGSGNEATTSGTIYGASSQLDTMYGIRDSVLVDSNAQTVYAFAGVDPSGDSGVYQFSTAFTSGTGTEVEVNSQGGTGTAAYQMAGIFDNLYYTSSSSSGNLYLCTTGAPATLYQIPITSNAMGAATAESTLGDSSYYGRCSPLNEFFNTSLPTAATGTVTIAANPSGFSSVTVTVGATTYTFVNSLTGVNQVLLVTSHNATTNETDTAENFEAVINNNSSQCSGGSGCVFSGQAANASVTATQSAHVVTLTSKTSGSSGDFALTTDNSTDITVSGGNNGSNGTDYAFLSVFAGVQTGCTDSANDGCILSFNITNPSVVTLSGTSLNVLASSTNLVAPTGGIIIDNAVGSGTLSGASEIYFLTTDNSSSVSCSTSGTGVCAIQASQSSP